MGSPTRDERRRRTERAVLAAARQLFGELGFERTTIRAVAAAAGVDPALVMQHHGSKEALFRVAARWDGPGVPAGEVGLADVPQAALADLFALEEGEGRDAAVALLRNCLTHPGAAQVMRDEVVCTRRDAVASAITAPDAELRAALVGACMMGLGMARTLLEVEPLASASQEDVARLLVPALRALVDPPA